jgi:AraC family transcriptional regulator of adaptative response/methylated-DNA-[protein]-cysteine methyltransferase
MDDRFYDKEAMYRAFAARDASRDGTFVAAVKTTGVFCRPGCPARKAKRENVEFFAGVRDALEYGYEPCKLCRPLEHTGSSPVWLPGLLADVHAQPAARIRDFDLRARGIDPEAARGWFKQHCGLTFHAYQKLCRINKAFGTVSRSARATAEEVRGFFAGVVPRPSAQAQWVVIYRLGTPLGPMLAGATAGGLCLLEFSDRPMLETQLKTLARYFGIGMAPGKNKHIEAAQKQLRAYFAGGLRRFDLPLDVPGTPFQTRAWEALRAIPYGRTRSYRQQAEATGNVRSVRAVARANGENRIAVIIPCHRVIGSDGGLTGYGGGLWRKHALLRLEGAHI